MSRNSLDHQSRAFSQVESRLNHPDRATRLEHLRAIVSANELGIRDVEPSDEVNNHVHTSFSFSPYSPAAAAFLARYAGLQAVGSIDHDSIGAADEMVAACRILGLGSTVGYELRVNFTGTSVEGRKLNNPDSHNIGYIVIHGVPAPAVPAVERFLEPIREQRNRRNRHQVERLNELLNAANVEPLDFEGDVVPRSQLVHGGSITERHILAALSDRLLSTAGNQALQAWLADRFGIVVPPRLASLIDDQNNPHRLYDLLGILKSGFLPRFFVQPDEAECISVADAVAFARSVGAIPCYSYLGDVTDSPTGDKKAEQFEDAFLEELFEEVVHLGFQGVTYMPPRNSREQLLRVIDLCRRHGLMEISGVDINSSRQVFTCPEIMLPEFRHLLGTTWALIAHEKLSSSDPKLGLFHPENPWSGLSLSERLATYSRFGADLDPFNPTGTIITGSTD
ncbi:MAG: PHP domain-containing protein [Spirochaetaceae bacterium]|nr:MAG: PHP domain-containing protein [Spirochaetaceae bacterium]